MKNNKLLDILLDLGLSENESRVYLANLSLGPSSILKIAQSAEVKRTTVYSVMESLKQHGLVRLDIRGFKQLYVAENPEKLQIMLDQRKESLSKSLPEFLALYNLKGGESFIRYYEGIEACKGVYENIIKEAKPGDDLLVVSDQEAWFNQDPDYFKSFLDRRSKVGLKVKKLLQDSPAIEKFGWGTPRFNEQIKILPQSTKLTTNMFIVPHKVVIHQIVPPILAIEIENNSVVSMNRQMFEIIWNSIPGGDKPKMTYETFTAMQLRELETAIKEVINDNQKVIDAGGVAGNISRMIEKIAKGCNITMLNHSKVLDVDKNYDYTSNSVEIVEKDPTIYFQSAPKEGVNLAIFNASLHEINTPQNQRQYLNELLLSVKNSLEAKGKVIIADYFYDPSIPKQELENFLGFLTENIGHADPPENFINPDLILEIAQNLGFKILHFHQNRMVKEIDRKFYIFVLEKI